MRTLRMARVIVWHMRRRRYRRGRGNREDDGAEAAVDAAAHASRRGPAADELGARVELGGEKVLSRAVGIADADGLGAGLEAAAMTALTSAVISSRPSK